LHAEIAKLTSIIQQQQQTIGSLELKLNAVLSLLQKPPANSSVPVTSAVAIDTTAFGTTSHRLYATAAAAAVGSSNSQTTMSPASAVVTAPRCRDTVAVMYVDQHERNKRANNVVVSGLPAKPGQSDLRLVADLIEKEFDERPHISRVRCLGRDPSNPVRPILVVMCRDEASRIIEHAKRLRESQDDFTRQHVYINADLTRAEAEAAYQIRCRRRAVAASHPNRQNHTFTNSQLHCGRPVGSVKLSLSSGPTTKPAAYTPVATSELSAMVIQQAAVTPFDATTSGSISASSSTSSSGSTAGVEGYSQRQSQ